MARKQTKKAQTIQSTVDAYAAGIVRRGVLGKQVQKNEFGISEAGKVLTAHVRAQNAGQVAYHAKNGLTLLVSPSDSWCPIRAVQPGKLKIEQREPATAAIAEDVASLLAAGDVTGAQQLIEQKLIESANTVKTATELQRDQAAAETRAMTHWYTERLPRLPRLPRLVFPSLRGVEPRIGFGGVMHAYGARVEPRIEQRTYKSATMGPIALSQTAKELLQENRTAVQTAVRCGDYNAQGMQVSRSRGKIAQYLSTLEQRVNRMAEELDQLRKRGA